jgi:hypothetical protein
MIDVGPAMIDRSCIIVLLVRGRDARHCCDVLLQEVETYRYLVAIIIQFFSPRLCSSSLVERQTTSSVIIRELSQDVSRSNLSKCRCVASPKPSPSPCLSDRRQLLFGRTSIRIHFTFLDRIDRIDRIRKSRGTTRVSPNPEQYMS